MESINGYISSTCLAIMEEILNSLIMANEAIRLKNMWCVLQFVVLETVSASLNVDQGSFTITAWKNASENFYDFFTILHNSKIFQPKAHNYLLKGNV